MPLQPTEKLGGLMMKFANWMTSRRFGKVILPVKVVTRRVPKSMDLSYEIAKLS